MINKTLTPKDQLPLTCTRTGTCCHGKNVNINPWELAYLAAAKNMSSIHFRDEYTEFGGIKLLFNGAAGWKDQNACSLYNENVGCTNHEGRPLACRLYPLGRQKQAEETTYIYQGTSFPCLEGCPDVINLPQLTVEDYIKGQKAQEFEMAQDVYLEVMQNLADLAFVLLLETKLAKYGDKETLRIWSRMSTETPLELTSRLPSEWLDLLMVPSLEIPKLSLIDFASQHNELLQSKAQESFNHLTSLSEIQEASCLLMGLALHLSRSLGANPQELGDLWINTAIQHGAQN